MALAYFGKLPFTPPPTDVGGTSHAILLEELEVLPPLPASPASSDWRKSIADDGGHWKALGNDGNADCTVAAAGHLMMSWSDNARGAPWYFSDKDAVADFKMYKNPGSSGAQMQNILDAWMDHGIHRRSGNGDGGPQIAVTIEDFGLLLVGDPTKLKLKEQIRQAIWLFGGCYIGFIMPKFVLKYDDKGEPAPIDPDHPGWDVSAAEIQAHGHDAIKDMKAGHCIPAIAYSSVGLSVVTWGNCVPMSWDFLFTYMDEAWVVLCKSAWLKDDDSTPSRLTEPDYVQSFKSLKAAGKGLLG
jgi:hypothetical protein